MLIEHIFNAGLDSACFANINLPIINPSVRWVLWLYPQENKAQRG